jgi:1-deoxy-D-xylulose-5-phosphate synthase
MSSPLLEELGAHRRTLKSFSIEELEELATQIRGRILQVLSRNGGHLASNLGAVELTLALHYVFDFPQDTLLFDTSHQIYTHKILTDRNASFDTLRQYKGISGFSHPEESPHDPFFLGHAGAVFSLSLGLAKRRDVLQKKGHVIAFLGDASFNCGLTLEAMNHIPKNLSRFLLVLNDNAMAISKNVGNITKILSRLLNNPTSNRLTQEILTAFSKIPAYGDLLAKKGQKVSESIKNLVSPAPFFEQFGLSYTGPVDGHDLKKLIHTFSQLKEASTPVVIHTLTQKGKGLSMAIHNPSSYHGAAPFDLTSGKFLCPSSKPTFPKIFGKTITEMAAKDPSLFVLTPAMIEGASLKEFVTAFPDRCIDVGIAEGHCLTFAGALAFGRDLHPVVCIYSTFLQRALDNLFHDICLQKAPLLLAIDRAGLNGPDGVTHHGIYDLAFLNAMPHLIIAQPRNGRLLKELLHTALLEKKPFAIRYPNRETEEEDLFLETREVGKGELLVQGEKVLLLPLGHMVLEAFEVREKLLKEGICPTIIDPIFLKPLDKDLLTKAILSHELIVTLEEHSIMGGFGSILSHFCFEHNLHPSRLLHFALPDRFLHHGANRELLKEAGLDAETISQKILSCIDLNQRALVEPHDHCTLSQ